MEDEDELPWFYTHSIALPVRCGHCGDILLTTDELSVHLRENPQHAIYKHVMGRRNA